ncbi:MAG: leucyl aminopeptidase, partial [Actinomycetota bacterium]
AVAEAAARSGERVWTLPLPDDSRRVLDSEVADLRNIATGGGAGTITAGLFLREFAGAGPWAHLDIAGTARASADDGEIAKGGTGFGVRLLVELARTFEAPSR